MRRCRLPILLACLAYFFVSVAQAADIEFVRVWPAWRDAESFESISEYFTGREDHGKEIVLRTHPDARAGFYYLVRINNRGGARDAQFALQVILPDAPEPRRFSFPVAVPQRSSVFHLGLTGPAWPQRGMHPVAWKLELQTSDGTILGSAQSFLWEKPTK